MNAWSAFGFGLLVGALIFDQLWRGLYRKTGRLLQMQREYINELETLDREDQSHGL